MQDKTIPWKKFGFATKIKLLIQKLYSLYLKLQYCCSTALLTHTLGHVLCNIQENIKITACLATLCVVSTRFLAKYDCHQGKRAFHSDTLLLSIFGLISIRLQGWHKMTGCICSLPDTLAWAEPRWHHKTSGPIVCDLTCSPIRLTALPLTQRAPSQSHMDKTPVGSKHNISLFPLAPAVSTAPASH